MSLQILVRRLERLPMLRALMPFAAGIVLADRYTLPALFVGAGFVLCGGMALVRRSSLYTAAALILFGWGVCGLHQTPSAPLPRNTRTGFALTVEGAGTGRITAWRDSATGRWREAEARVAVHADSTLALRTGERLVFTGYLNELSATLPAYAELMRRRGCVGTVWLSDRLVLQRKPAEGATLHTAAVERLRRLGLAETAADKADRADEANAADETYPADNANGKNAPDKAGVAAEANTGAEVNKTDVTSRAIETAETHVAAEADTADRTCDSGKTNAADRASRAYDAQALCEAMAAGERAGLRRELREAYARSGTAHLLAVSGLHVGIVFVLVNLLLVWLPALRRGHLLRNAAATALVWVYAAVAGFPPSVVRAALMCTALQFSLASASVYASGNVLAAAAFGMLVWNPDWLFDLSFQLSFAAVAAILAWAVPLCRRLRTPFRPLNALTDTLAVGLAASVATAPLAAHTFGYVPLVGLAVNPVIIPLAAAVVFGSVVWMIAPLAFAAPLFRLVLGTAAAWQNALVEWAAGVSWAVVPWAPSAGQTAAIYLLFVGITAAAWCVEPKKKVSLHR